MKPNTTPTAVQGQPCRRRGKHTLESCRIAAAKFKNRTAFFNGNRQAYRFAQRRGLLDDVCAHMGPKSLGGMKRKWTFETCKAEAAKYSTRTDYSRGSSGSWERARREGWLNIICAHMVDGRLARYAK